MKKFVEVTLSELHMSDLTGNANVIIAKLQRIINENQDAVDVRVVHDTLTGKCHIKASKYMEQP